MPFYGEWERILDGKWRLTFPAKFQDGIGSRVFLAAAPKNGGLRILPSTFKPPKGKERKFHEVDVELGGSSRILIEKDVRRQFHLLLKPRRKVLIVGCGDHLELYPVGSR